MKSNEAPEKIYVQLPSRNWIGRTWNETPIKEGDNPNWENATNIEYTRTDAFMEKVCGWIKMRWSETDDRFKEDFTGMLIENFKNHIMKGE